MRVNKICAAVVFTGLFATFAPGADNAGGGDVQFEVGAEIADSFEVSIAGYVQQAQKTLQKVKNEFMGGMQKGRKLFLTIRIMDATGRVEQIFAEVKKWNGSEISGDIASRIQSVSGYSLGQGISFGEGDILDWTILNSDGSTEGNFIGNYVKGWLDSHVSEAS